MLVASIKQFLFTRITGTPSRSVRSARRALLIPSAILIADELLTQVLQIDGAAAQRYSRGQSSFPSLRRNLLQRNLFRLFNTQQRMHPFLQCQYCPELPFRIRRYD
jgi:hypothetical protein